MRRKKFYQIRINTLNERINFLEQQREFWRGMWLDAMEWEKELIHLNLPRRWAWDEMDEATQNIKELDAEIRKLREEKKRYEEIIENAERRGKKLGWKYGANKKLNKLRRRAIKHAKEIYAEGGLSWGTALLLGWNRVKKHRRRHPVNLSLLSTVQEVSADVPS